MSWFTFDSKPSNGFGRVATGELKLKGAALETPFEDIVDIITVGLTSNL